MSHRKSLQRVLEHAVRSKLNLQRKCLGCICVCYMPFTTSLQELCPSALMFSACMDFKFVLVAKACIADRTYVPFTFRILKFAHSSAIQLAMSCNMHSMILRKCTAKRLTRSTLALKKLPSVYFSY